MSQRFAIVLASALLLAPVSAIAEGPNNAPLTEDQQRLAIKHYEDGERLFKDQKYDLAQIEFEACFAITKNADFLHNLSLVAEKQGQVADAIAYEETFLEQKRGELNQFELDQTNGRIARLRAQLKPPAPQIPAGDVERKPSIAIDRHRPPAAAIGLMTGGAAALLVGIGSGVGALATQKTVSDGGQYFPNEYQALLNRGEALNGAAIAFDVIGGVALGAGVTWAIVDRVRSKRSASPTVSRALLALSF